MEELNMEHSENVKNLMDGEVKMSYCELVGELAEVIEKQKEIISQLLKDYTELEKDHIDLFTDFVNK